MSASSAVAYADAVARKPPGATHLQVTGTRSRNAAWFNHAVPTHEATGGGGESEEVDLPQLNSEHGDLSSPDYSSESEEEDTTLTGLRRRVMAASDDDDETPPMVGAKMAKSSMVGASWINEQVPRTVNQCKAGGFCGLFLMLLLVILFATVAWYLHQKGESYDTLMHKVTAEWEPKIDTILTVMEQTMRVTVAQHLQPMVADTHGVWLKDFKPQMTNMTSSIAELTREARAVSAVAKKEKMAETLSELLHVMHELNSRVKALLELNFGNTDSNTDTGGST